jgi:hypothetical protein
MLGGLEVLKRGADPGGQPGDGLDVVVFKGDCLGRELEESYNLLVPQYGDGEAGVASIGGFKRKANCLASLDALAKGILGDVCGRADFWNHGPGGCGIYELPALFEGHSHSGCGGEEARALGQQLHGGVKFERR